MLLCALEYCKFTCILLSNYLSSVKLHTTQAGGNYSTLPQVPIISDRDNIVPGIDFTFRPTKGTVHIRYYLFHPSRHLT